MRTDLVLSPSGASANSPGGASPSAAVGLLPIVCGPGSLAVRTTGFVLLFVIWTICNPFFEIDRSSLIYTGRALADLSPETIGRDVMFRLNGQSGFTIFTGLYRALATGLGVPTATLLLSAASIAASFGGVVVLATAICAGRTRSLAIVFAAALPACYGGFKFFSFSETAATPRPFAEALVLCAIAALLRDRRWAAAGLLLGAAVLHPIMALPGLLLAVVWLGGGDRRWLVALAIAAAAVLCLAILHEGVFERLTRLVDPAWRAVLAERNPQLFPTLWPGGWSGRMAVRGATLAIAASLAPPPVRKLFLVTMAVGVAGFAASYGLADRIPIVMLVQAQVWRTMWLVYAMATLAAAICATGLWSRGRVSRIVLALLALCWIFESDDRIALLLVVACLGLHFASRGLDDMLSPRATNLLLGMTALVGAAGLVQAEFAIAAMGGEPWRDNADRLSTLNADWDHMPIAALGAFVLIAWRSRPRLSTLLGPLVCASIVLAATWDRRSLETRAFDAAIAAPDLKRLVSGHPGEVFWIGGVRESWLWLDRPQWLSPIQGAGLVFSRQLALLYRERAERAIAAGLETRGIMSPWADGEAGTISLAAARIESFCAAPDAPAWIIAPATLDDAGAARLSATRWTAPVVKLMPVAAAAGGISWRRISDYDIVPCARAPTRRPSDAPPPV